MHTGSGNPITLRGQVSREPWQHMIGPLAATHHVNYIDTVDGDQLVVYSVVPIEDGVVVDITGTTILLEGRSKRPGSTDVYTELQLLATSVTPAGLCGGGEP